MKLRKFLIFLLFVATSLPTSWAQEASFALLSPQQLNDLIAENENLVVMDLRKEADYRKNHIPGAINVNRRNFVNKDLDYGGMMSSKEQTEKLLSELGVSNNSDIVLYDVGSVYDAARLWFVLKQYGHNTVQILDGGFTKWMEAGLTTSNKEVKLSPSKYLFEPIDSKYAATFSDVNEKLGSKEVIILDVRSDKEYTDGHIPGALNLNWVNNLDENELIKSKDILQKQFEEAGVTSDKEIITYCRSGVRASHTAFVLREILGFNKVKIYDGSWIEWTYRDGKVEK